MVVLVFVFHFGYAFFRLFAGIQRSIDRGAAFCRCRTSCRWAPLWPRRRSNHSTLCKPFLFLDLNFTFASLIRISQLTESGIYRHWIGEIFVLNDKSTRTTRIGSDFEALQTKHFHGLSALFGIGMFFAAISACIEFVKNKSN